MKVLILINQTSNQYFPIDDDERFVPIYRNTGLFFRAIRKIILKLNLPFKKLLFGHFHKKAVAADMIILFDIRNAREILMYLKKEYPEKKIIFWYWNPVCKADPVQSINDLGIEIWSFDPVDCKKYGLKYNTQIFIDRKTTECNDKNTDVFYVGVDKNRAKTLTMLAKLFKENDISYYFNLVRTKDSEADCEIQYGNTMNYSEVLSYVKSSKVIVDLCAVGQSGLTLRPIESIFLKKKIITNMNSIVEYDIYNKNNIFILGEDDIENLKEFIRSEYDETNNPELLKKYEFESWLNRFYEGEEARK